MRTGADVTLYVPTADLVEPPARPNARRRQPTLEHPALDLYEGQARFLVRTAIIRSEEYDDGKRAPTVATSKDAAMLTAHLAHADQEHLVSIALGATSRLLAIHEVAIGSSSGVAQQLQHIVKVAFLTTARAMIIVHNHPSGDPRPSLEDVALTKELKKGMDCLHLTLLDHVIVAHGDYYSFNDHSKILT